MTRLSLSLCVLAALAVPVSSFAQAPDAAATVEAANPALANALKGTWRSADNVARDAYRHPAETLAFFGVTPSETVLEVTPGGGWYSEILAPYLHDSGQYLAAVADPGAYPEGKDREYYQRGKTRL